MRIIEANQGFNHILISIKLFITNLTSKNKNKAQNISIIKGLLLFGQRFSILISDFLISNMPNTLFKTFSMVFKSQYAEND